MRRKKVYRILIVSMIVLAAFVGWIIWGNSALELNSIIIQCPRLPNAFSGFTIAHISDLHNTTFGNNNEKLLSMLRDASPDIIVVTGDLIDSRKTDVETAAAFMEKALMIAPVYYVTGNHESRVIEFSMLQKRLEAMGVTVLRNESMELCREDSHILLVGLDDSDFYSEIPSQQAVSAALTLLCNDADQFTILLSHRPELFQTYAAYPIDVVFSGHAHGGQVRLPFLGGLVAPGQGLFPEYDAGVYRMQDIQMIVSRGLGNSLFPFRVNNRPEVLLVTLTTAQ